MKTILIQFFLLISISSISQIKVTLHEIKGYGIYEEFAKESAAKFEMALNSSQFRDSIINGKFYHTNGKTNLELYNIIMKASEIGSRNVSDGVVDLKVRFMSKEIDGRRWMRYCSKRTIGKEAGKDGYIATCPSKVQSWSENNEYHVLAGHYAHEYMHHLGFGHPKKHKYESLVYQVGYIIANIVNEMP